MSQYKQIESRVGKVIQDAQRQLQDIADKFRKETLIPFCKRHQLTYLAGMGSCAFYNKNGAPVAEYDRPCIKRINDILNIDAIGRNDCFGFYISDVTKEDIQ